MWQWLLIGLGLIIVVLGIFAIYYARKLDALHRTVTKSRVVLEKALLQRSKSANDVALANILDPAGAILLADISAEAARAAAYPVVDDGLDEIRIVDGDGVVHGGNSPVGQAPNRLALESELTRTLRVTVDDLTDGEKQTDKAKELLAELTDARDAVRMSRRFHNAHVARARRVRRVAIVRIFHLQGSAPVPKTVDIDDE